MSGGKLGESEAGVEECKLVYRHQLSNCRLSRSYPETGFKEMRKRATFREHRFLEADFGTIDWK
jgi:hypothetical protein